MDRIVKVYSSKVQAEKNKAVGQVIVKIDNGYIAVDYNICQLIQSSVGAR